VISGPGHAIERELGALGAQVVAREASEDEAGVDRFVEDVLSSHGRIDTLVNCAAGEDFRVDVEGTWLMTHAVATKAMIPDSRGGKIVNVTAEPPAVRAGLENLARVLSIEWARFDVKLNAISAGGPEETAWFAAFLASPAGDYFSGAVLG
jgi:NAD(P)-dependent dehydrogenase (short-subunit alcohol dehydrogenase family)